MFYFAHYSRRNEVSYIKRWKIKTELQASDTKFTTVRNAELIQSKRDPTTTVKLQLCAAFCRQKAHCIKGRQFGKAGGKQTEFQHNNKLCRNTVKIGKEIFYTQRFLFPYPSSNKGNISVKLPNVQVPQQIKFQDSA